MSIKVISTSHKNYIASKNDFDMFGGNCAGVCYMSNNFDTLLNEPEEKTIKRAQMTKESGHHSVFDHSYISLYLENIPKMLAVVLNNERMYTTSEKSGRYTQMALTNQEQVLYDKWLEIFKEQIKAKYASTSFFTETRINKLAQENARYLTSIFTPVSLVYTVSYRQLNYLYTMLFDFSKKSHKDELTSKLSQIIVDFCKELKETGYIDEDLINNVKDRQISLFANRRATEEYFGEVYSTTYKGTLAQFAQAQRHRTIIMSITQLNSFQIYTPKIIKSDKVLCNQWLKDVLSLKDNFPQAMLFKINEKGTIENFVLKTKERLCSFAQLEIYEQTYKTLTKYLNNIKNRNKTLYKYLNKYNRTSRCQFADYTCLTPCKFPEGIKGTRKI